MGASKCLFQVQVVVGSKPRLINRHALQTACEIVLTCWVPVADKLCNMSYMTDREYAQIGAPMMQITARRNAKPNARRKEDFLSQLRLYQYSTRDGTQETNTKLKQSLGSTQELFREQCGQICSIYKSTFIHASNRDRRGLSIECKEEVTLAVFEKGIYENKKTKS